MNNTKDIILIYANAERKDLGVLQDYSFDMCYGDSENNFECRLQKYNPALTGDEPIQDDFILYIEFTEYGGIIDKKTIDSKRGEITLSGRTWHGFLNSFVIEPLKGFPYRTYQGEANSVISQIITDIGMGDWFVVENENSEITIPFTTVRYEKAYDCIMKMLIQEDAKLAMWYQNNDESVGKVHLMAVSRVNTGVFEDFDTSQTPFKAGKAYNKVNDLICLGPGEGADRAVIHLYADENGGILPHNRNWPRQDSDYYTDLEALSHSTNPEDQANYQIIMSKMPAGSKKYSLVYDYPNAGIVTNYIRLDTKPDNWEGTYYNYYYLDLAQQGDPHVKFKRTYHDDYKLLETVPDDWQYNYKNYYLKEHSNSTSLKKVEELSEEQGAVIKYYPNQDDDGYDGLQYIDPNEWKNYFETEYEDKEDLYYEKVAQMSEYVYKKAEPATVETYKNVWTALNGKPPFDWETNYGSYFMRYQTGTGYAYTPVTGDEKEKYILQTARPTDWSENFGSYYMKEKKKKHKTASGIVIIEVGEYITVSQAISEGLLDDWYVSKNVVYRFPKWKKKAFYTKTTETVTPAYVHERSTPSGNYVLPFVKETKSVAPEFVSGKYYIKLIYGTPPWKKRREHLVDDVPAADDFGGYYEKLSNVEIIPTFERQDVYYAVQDRFHDLCVAGVEKLYELADKDSLEISLELESNYDVGDVVGGVDEETGIEVVKRILRKIIKIKKGILSVDYEVD